MYLTNEEEKMLEGEYGYAVKKAMEILVALGKIYNADKLIPIKSAHISGISYYNIGESGLEFLKDFLRGVRVKVKTTINPCAMDIERWNEMGIGREFAYKQLEIIKYFREAGVEASLTCTPYYSGNRPSLGDHIAWSESSAVAYANSIIGARSNRESGISALAAAIVGKTPYYGMHVKDERAPQVYVKIGFKLRYESDYGVLGYIISKYTCGLIPLIKLANKPSETDLRILSASISTYSNIPMYHIQDLTPESSDFDIPREKITIDKDDINEGYKYLHDDFDKPDLIWIGCPHASLEDIAHIASLLRGRRIDGRFWITTSRSVYLQALNEGYIKLIEDAGGKVYADTCVAVMPLKGIIENIITNSAKGCYYARGLNRLKVKVYSLNEIIESAAK